MDSAHSAFRSSNGNHNRGSDGGGRLVRPSYLSFLSGPSPSSTLSNKDATTTTPEECEQEQPEASHMEDEGGNFHQNEDLPSSFQVGEDSEMTVDEGATMNDDDGRPDYNEEGYYDGLETHQHNGDDPQDEDPHQTDSTAVIVRHGGHDEDPMEKDYSIQMEQAEGAMPSDNRHNEGDTAEGTVSSHMEGDNEIDAFYERMIQEATPKLEHTLEETKRHAKTLLKEMTLFARACASVQKQWTLVQAAEHAESDRLDVIEPDVHGATKSLATSSRDPPRAADAVSGGIRSSFVATNRAH